MTAHIPVEIWLIVFEFIPDYDALWSTVRNSTRYLRACVDEFFRRNVLRESVIGLIYSTIHRHDWPAYHLVYVPMRFDRLSNDGTRAVFRQARVPEHGPHILDGSVRGWVPFIERHCKDTRTSAPRVMNKTKGIEGPPFWEEEYRRWCNERPSVCRLSYFQMLRNYTSIGRGDRPPYLIKLAQYAHDTEIVGLHIDCAAREISLDWRRTFTNFFVEVHFVVLAEQHRGKKREYDKRLASASNDALLRDRSLVRRSDSHLDSHLDDWRRARRKRLQPWVKKNKRRMSNLHRLIVEDSIFDGMKVFSSDKYSLDNLVELKDGDVDLKEIVPEHCGRTYRRLTRWPTNRDQKELKMLYKERMGQKKPCIGCAVM